MEKYNQDPRTPCKYGFKCYQKNPAHHKQFKHPPKNNKKTFLIGNPAKKIKLDELVKQREKEDEKSNLQKETEKVSDSDENEEESLKETESPAVDNQNNATQQQTEDIHEDEELITEDINEDKEPISFDPKTFIKKRFLLDLPSDFYSFWEFCENLKPSSPCDAFKELGLTLVGPFDVLAERFKHVKKPHEEYLQHWRYFYDPPEALTVIKGDDSTGYHICYFFDSPNETPSFLASNYGLKDGVFTKLGDNIFAAVSIYLEEQQKIGDPFKKVQISKMLSLVKSESQKLGLNLSAQSAKIKERESKVVAKTLNKLGLVVPYDKKTQLGYRELAMKDTQLMLLLNKLDKASSDQKPRLLTELQPVLTYASIALDECDFGTGVKLGWELLYHGIDSLNSTIAQFLGNSYRLLNKDVFAKIAEAHMKNRRKTAHLSII